LADVLIVHITESYKLERTRTALRDFVAHKLKRGDGEDNSYKEAALVAFVAPDLQSWRFSYVRMEYATTRDPKTGKIKPEERLTPARRHSYLVGTDEECHTAQSRFLALLQNTSVRPTLAQIEEAFSIEAVTKEFFGEYVRLFEDTEAALTAMVKGDKTIRDDFMAKGVSTVDFAKKLLGQIVFLYFIQKKGWLGVPKGGKWGDGPRNFLRQIADCAIREKKSLFNEVLEPLFYDTLATDRGDEAWCKTFSCRIPFLNGGLFEPLANYDWEKTEINLPNKLFTNQTLTIAGDVGDGILDVFDRYNFTVNEAEPLEKEVAIDPEMLGKVFENLIEENRRKGLGAFYTPREIVHYMCQESLINYLDTTVNRQGCVIQRTEIEALIREGEQAVHYEAARKDGTVSYARRLPETVEKHACALDEALKNITVCDPAVGSGAFPVGMMTEIVRSRCALTTYFSEFAERTPYKFKRHAIQNCLYGVDIDSGAVEIAKLRLWLSLIVDEDDVKQIKPLPNLDYKIVAGNSLLGFPFKSQRIHKIEILKCKYFNETDTKKKRDLKKEIDTEIVSAFANSKKSLGYEVTFDFDIYFSEVLYANKGFDIVIANPPYVGEKGHKEMFRCIATGPLKDYYQGKMDLFYFFFHLALNLSHEHGNVAFITTNYYTTATGAKKLRNDFKNRAIVHNLVNFNELKIFESALGQHNMITILEKGYNSDVVTNNCITKRQGFGTPEILRNILQRHDEETTYYRVNNADLYSEKEGYIRLMGDATISEDPISVILNTLKKQGVPLGTICNINCGIQTGCDRVKTEDVHQGVFVLDKTEIRDIPRQERTLLRPFFKNSDIRKYFCSAHTDLRVIYTDRNFTNPSDFPVIIKHLEKFRKRLGEIREVKNGIIRYYQLQWPREEKIFTSAKIVVPQRSRANIFAYTEIDWYASVDVYFITQKDLSISLKYVLALLNANFYFVWLYRNGKRKGEMLELYQKPLSEIPIKMISPQEQKPFIVLVDKILAVKHRDPTVDTSDLERELDRLVYTLYGLTPDEIKIMEGGGS
jgi:type I restriction-modification system DNA methylase subunit